MRKITIIGIGPRGLFALEQFLSTHSEKKKFSAFQILLFDCSQYPGAGEVWNLEQPSTNWMNISERALTDLPAREAFELQGIPIPEFPSYSEWSAKEDTNVASKSIDTFPPRAKMGNYLHQRFKSIIAVLVANEMVTLYPTKILTVIYEKNNFTLTDEDHKTYSADEVLLTIGHQPTKISEQIQDWLEHSKKTERALLFEESYPISKIIDAPRLDNESIVGLRGFGLATIDVIRALTIARGGQFKLIDERTREVDFVSSKKVPKKLVPFSLDGLPLAAKPINSEEDEKFTPTASEIKAFGKKISRASSEESEEKDTAFIIEAIAPIASRLYDAILKEHGNATKNSNELYHAITSWLSNPTYEHPFIFSKTNSTTETIAAFIQMATGNRMPSLDYCIGQVWRHCQPTLYKKFSHAKLPDEVIADTIKLDERIKRYSYGPPVDSIQQLLAVQKAGILDLDYIENPEIKLVDSGWELQSDKKSIVCDCMVNCVLDAPKLLEIKSSLIKSLLQDDLVKPLHSTLGIHTQTNGCVITEENKEIPIAVLGRLSKGSVIGVDAILECFGPRTKDWAKGAVARMFKKVN